MKKTYLLAAIAAAALVAPVQAASVIVNGSFESGPPVGNFVQLNAGNTSIPGWTIGGNSVDYIGSYWSHADGNYSIDLSGGGAGSLSQTFATQANRLYRVTFALAGNPAGGPTTKNLTVSATGGADTDYTFDTTGKSLNAMGWTRQVYTFTASGSSTTLTFTSNDNTVFGPALDNVTAGIPEPATWAMMILGFGFIGAALRRAKPRVTASYA